MRRALWLWPAAPPGPACFEKKNPPCWIWDRCHYGTICLSCRPNFTIVAIKFTTIPCWPGPCITNVFATRHKNSSQWQRSFQRKLRPHWLKFLRHVAITLVIQGPGQRASPLAQRDVVFLHWTSYRSNSPSVCRRLLILLLQPRLLQIFDPDGIGLLIIGMYSHNAKKYKVIW